MSIERTEGIHFHVQGTLNTVTRWIATHPEGIAEWLKNVRRQYQVDRANVADEHRAAVLLMKDASAGEPARIGVLDVGGATLEDVSEWGHWQNPEASSRGSELEEEETQGNGGKAYMYRLFTGPTRIFGVKDGRRNCSGFEGAPGSVERGTPGWIPNVAEGRDVEISAWKGELRGILAPYDVTFDQLPEAVSTAIAARKAFTLVEGAAPCHLYKGRIDADELIEKVVRHEQSTLCLEQVAFYVFHNGRLMNDGKRLTLPPIAPWHSLDCPIVFEIPDQLPLENGQTISTTEGGTREPGRLILHTSADNMYAAYKNLKPRWQVSYRTKHQMIGAKPISDPDYFAATPAGAQFVYGTVELAALEPAYVDHGRRRPKPGPLVEALDKFISEKIRGIAQQINAKRQQKLDERALDRVHEENQRLNELKNEFLPSQGDGSGSAGAEGPGPRKRGGGGKVDWGTAPDVIELSAIDGELCVGTGVALPLRSLLEVSVRDTMGRPVRAPLEWTTSDTYVATVSEAGDLRARSKGSCEIQVRVKGTGIEAKPIT